MLPLLGVVLAGLAVLVGGFMSVVLWGQMESEISLGCDYKLEQARRLATRLDDNLVQSETSIGVEIDTGEWFGARDAASGAQSVAAQLAQRVDQVGGCRDNLVERKVASRSELEGLEARWGTLVAASSFVARQDRRNFTDLAQPGVYSYSCRGMDDYVGALREGVLESVAGSAALRMLDLDAAAARVAGWERALASAESGLEAMRECAESWGVGVAGLEAAFLSEQAAWAEAAARLAPLWQRVAERAEKP